MGPSGLFYGPLAMFYPATPWSHRMGNVFGWIAAETLGRDSLRLRVVAYVRRGWAPPAMVEFRAVDGLELLAPLKETTNV